MEKLQQEVDLLINYANLMIVAKAEANKRREVADDFALSMIDFFGTRHLKSIFSTKDINIIQSQLSDKIMGVYK